MRGGKKSIHAIITWLRRQPPKAKAFIAVVSSMAALVLLRIIVHDHDNLFVAAEAVHSLGISVLIYKLIKEKTCAGHLSLLSTFFNFPSFLFLIKLLNPNFIFLFNMSAISLSKFGIALRYALIFNLTWPTYGIKLLFGSERSHWIINGIVWMILFACVVAWNEEMPFCFILVFSLRGAGLSLKSQELTAMFLAVRLYCSFVMEYDIHTLLDLATFATTVWVIYMIRFKLRSSYMQEKDNFAIYYVVISPTTPFTSKS